MAKTVNIAEVKAALKEQKTRLKVAQAHLKEVSKGHEADAKTHAKRIAAAQKASDVAHKKGLAQVAKAQKAVDKEQGVVAKLEAKLPAPASAEAA